jgi:hypothetical protein
MWIKQASSSGNPDAFPLPPQHRQTVFLYVYLKRHLKGLKERRDTTRARAEDISLRCFRRMQQPGQSVGEARGGHLVSPHDGWYWRTPL